MSQYLTEDTKAILLLAAPLVTGGNKASFPPLTMGEYRQAAAILHELGCRPADLLEGLPPDFLARTSSFLQPDRIRYLLGRGFQLSQAVERWQSHAIWVLSRADEAYPQCWKSRLRNDAPPILYGCGPVQILGQRSLGVVGSRNADAEIIEWTRSLGQLVADSENVLVSGGARGVDQEAMRGASIADGRVAGILADSLEKAVLVREHRDRILNGRMVLVSPYDPKAGFNVGNAMQRNKLIYAASSAVLVVCSDFERGGTWAGAVEQLKRHRFVPVYVRHAIPASKGLDALQGLGAKIWPSPMTGNALSEILEPKNPEEAPDAATTSNAQNDPVVSPEQPSIDVRANVLNQLATTKSVVALEQNLGLPRKVILKVLERLQSESLAKKGPKGWKAVQPTLL